MTAAVITLPISVPLQNFHDPVIVFRLMGKAAIHAAFDPPAVLFHPFRIAGTLPVIERTKAEQTIDLFPVMTGIILAIPVLKVFTVVFHHRPLSSV